MLSSLNPSTSNAKSPNIVTLTMNPALDVSTAVAQVTATHKLRCEDAQTHPGGGGVNVARVIHRLGAACLALFPSGGVNGQAIASLLAKEDVPFQSTPIEGDSRESFSVHEHHTGLDYRFVLPGPTLRDSEWRACLAAVQSHMRPQCYVVASGSLPPGVPEDFYAQLAQLCQQQGAYLVLDTSGPPLRSGLQGGVYLFKPSLRELQELTGQALGSRVQRIQAARELIHQGHAQLVALSLGDEGAMLITKERAWQAPAITVSVASTIGAGDSFLAGLVWALDQRLTLEQAFAHAMASAAAALLSRGTALCHRTDVMRLLPQVKINAC